MKKTLHCPGILGQALRGSLQNKLNFFFFFFDVVIFYRDMAVFFSKNSLKMHSHRTNVLEVVFRTSLIFF